ncbi:hypothetical protein GCM10010977_11080 [Citricoccus zhacaiensis]|uniref:Uncharacterized protein n=1 Tax=Citricoccus zhacaiensis TaxID=489142 RepID=A0ABQ2LU60_9MICC|nr:hypothetical protein [Citricoccus zhacaiensis]GGO43270.1 hypothetical protein GCM10010977_11080 [Citricoccus zhacaiensis]
MAFNDYNISADAARGIVESARNRFQDLDGMENKLQATGDAVASAADEAKITTALKDSYTNFQRPFVVTMITTADNIFSTTDNVINIYDNADTSMAEDAKATAVEDMGYEATKYDNVPDYSPTDSTGDQGKEETSW